MATGVVASATQVPTVQRSLNRPRLATFAPSGRAVARVQRLKAAAPEETPVEGSDLISPPEGVTQPTRIPDIPPGRFGFVDYAERLNSRVAMIGFFGILIVELIANQGILQLAGFNVGSGLGFEF